MKPQTLPMPAAKPLEKEIQSGIFSTLRDLGFNVYWLSQPRETMQSKGVPDLLAVGRGRVALIEVKRPGEKQTEAQKLLEASVNANGGTYLLLHSSEEAVRWVESLNRGVRRPAS